MELLVAFLIAFGVVNSGDAAKLDSKEAAAIVKKTDLEKEAVIWGIESDDF